jgi:hypothetical protein
MYLTRNQAWAQVHRGFESHPLRQKSKPLLRGFCFLLRERACSRVGFEGFGLQAEPRPAECRRIPHQIKNRIKIECDSKRRACKPDRGLQTVGESQLYSDKKMFEVRVGFEATSKQVGCRAYHPTTISAKKSKPLKRGFCFVERASMLTNLNGYLFFNLNIE